MAKSAKVGECYLRRAGWGDVRKLIALREDGQGVWVHLYKMGDRNESSMWYGHEAATRCRWGRLISDEEARRLYPDMDELVAEARRKQDESFRQAMSMSYEGGL